jgi:hypothetical protein
MIPGIKSSEVAITLNLNNIVLKIYYGADESVIAQTQTLRILKNIC